MYKCSSCGKNIVMDFNSYGVASGLCGWCGNSYIIYRVTDKENIKPVIDSKKINRDFLEKKFKGR